MTLNRAVVFMSSRLTKKVGPRNKTGRFADCIVVPTLFTCKSRSRVLEIRVNLILIRERRIRQVGRPVRIALIRSVIGNSGRGKGIIRDIPRGIP